MYGIKGKSERRFRIIGTWPGEFNNDTLIVFIFDRKVIEENPWQKVKNNYIVKKRYDISLQTMKEKNWRIVYE